MPQPELEALQRELRSLAQRVALIESRMGVDAPAPAPAGALPPAKPQARPKPPAAESLAPVVGRALLGLAGAYVLRALTESAVLPARAGVSVGMIYALLWLVWAARQPAAYRVAAAVYSLTAALVMAPLLWEGILRFHVVSTQVGGAVLLLFTLFGLAVSWRRDLSIVGTVSTLAGLGTASALLMATHDVLPFLFVFLAIGAAVEAAACLDHWLNERWLAALAVDSAVWLATWLVTNEYGLPPAYAAIPQGGVLLAQILLLAIYLSSTIVRTLLRGFTFTAFETAQCALAFAIGVGGGLRLSHAGPAIGSLALVGGLACYVVSFVLLDRGGPHGRNFYTYSTFAILLALVGTRVLLPEAAWGAWSALAIAGLWAGGLFGRLTLEVHGALYLMLALASSGALKQAALFLLDSANWPDENRAAIVIGTLVAASCYALAVRYTEVRDSRNFRALRLAVAAVLVWVAAGISAGALTAAYHAGFGAGATHAYCATLRTGVLAAAALVAAWAGSRRPGLELSRLIYPLMALGAYRLLTLDLHQERTPALVLSLLLYGTALMTLPRLSRTREIGDANLG